MKACYQNLIRLLPLILLLTFPSVQNVKGASFVETGSAGTGRFVGTATRLANGQVLLAGGGGNPIFENVASAEIYEPNAGTWSPAGSIAGAATATVLLPDGKLLLLETQSSNETPAAEIYDPATGRWTLTASPAAIHPNAVLLQNGKVLAIAARDTNFEPLTTSEFVSLRSEEHTSELQSRGHLVCRL